MAVGWREQYTRYRGFFLNIRDLYKKRADLRAFFEVILSLSTIVIFIAFALKPTVLTIISLNQQIQEKEKTLAALEEKNRNLDVANDLLIQNSARVSDINSSIGTSPNPDAVSKQILGVATKNNTSLLGLSIGQATIVGEDPTGQRPTDFKPIEGAGGEMTISISARGDFQSVNSFVSDLENLRIAIKIDSLTINSSLTEEGQVIVAVVAGRVPYTKVSE